MSTRDNSPLRAWALVFLLLALVPGVASGRERVLRIAYAEDPRTLDPSMVVEEANFELLSLLYLPLLDFNDVTNIFPCAARSWSVSPDWRTFTFHLRPEVRFSNGRQVVAADYAYTLERCADPKTGSMLQGYLTGIEGAEELAAGKTNHLRGVRTPDPDTLVVELTSPDVTFPYVMSFMPALPQEVLRKPGLHFSTDPVCTGPYRVSRFQRGDCLTLVPNPYYGGREPAHFTRIEVRLGLDQTTQMMMFERGELDIIRAPFAELKRIRTEPRLKRLCSSIPLMSDLFLVMNTEMPPFNDVRVRQAVSYAIDRARRVFARNGNCEVAKGMIPSVLPAFDPHLKGYDYEPAKARALLAAAKVKTPLRLPLWYVSDNPFTAALAQGIAADLKAIGLEVELNCVTLAVLDDATAQHGRVPLFLNGWTMSLPDPKDCLGTQFDGRLIDASPGLNMAFYNNPEVNRRLDQAAATIDSATRIARYRAVERLILADAPYAFLAYDKLFALRQPWVKGPMLDAIWWFRFDRVYFQ